MRAAVYHGPHDIRIEQVPEPGQPGPEELLITVSRAAICGTDSSEWQHGPHMIPLEQQHPASGHRGPLVLGHEFTGRVLVAGDAVNSVAVGERVVCGAGVSCGECAWCRAGRTNLCASYYTLGLSTDGGLAEQVRAPASICRTVPDALADDAAAIAQPLAVGIHALNRGGVSAGDSVVVIGVGGIGALVVGAAVRRRPGLLVAVDIDPARLAAATALGADETIDARDGDVAEAVLALTGGDGADVVIEACGVPTGPTTAVHATRRGGRVVIIGLQPKPPSVDLYDAALREVELVTTVAHVCSTDLPEALEVLADSDLATSVTEKTIILEALVEEGIVPLAEGRASGKIVVDVEAA
jgi:(R,R)-butanediol dehydrogenase / meso-butanediol dehydrogenase / diacetyl reductase